MSDAPDRYGYSNPPPQRAVSGSARKQQRAAYEAAAVGRTASDQAGLATAGGGFDTYLGGANEERLRAAQERRLRAGAAGEDAGGARSGRQRRTWGESPSMVGGVEIKASDGSRMRVKSPLPPAHRAPDDRACAPLQHAAVPQHRAVSARDTPAPTSSGAGADAASRVRSAGGAAAAASSSLLQQVARDEEEATPPGESVSPRLSGKRGLRIQSARTGEVLMSISQLAPQNPDDFAGADDAAPAPGGESPDSSDRSSAHGGIGLGAADLDVLRQSMATLGFSSNKFAALDARAPPANSADDGDGAASEPRPGDDDDVDEVYEEDFEGPTVIESDPDSDIDEEFRPPSPRHRQRPQPPAQPPRPPPPPEDPMPVMSAAAGRIKRPLSGRPNPQQTPEAVAPAARPLSHRDGPAQRLQAPAPARPQGSDMQSVLVAVAQENQRARARAAPAPAAPPAPAQPPPAAPQPRSRPKRVPSQKPAAAAAGQASPATPGEAIVQSLQQQMEALPEEFRGVLGGVLGRLKGVQDAGGDIVQLLSGLTAPEAPQQRHAAPPAAAPTSVLAAGPETARAPGAEAAPAPARPADCVVLRLFSSWDGGPEVGLTQVELVDGKGRKLPLQRHHVTVHGAPPGVVGRLVSGRTHTTEQSHMWLARLPKHGAGGARPHVDVVVEVPPLAPGQTPPEQVRVWNYNRGLLGLGRGAKDVQIRRNDTVVWQGVLRKGTGKATGDYSTTVPLVAGAAGTQPPRHPSGAEGKASALQALKRKSQKRLSAASRRASEMSEGRATAEHSGRPSPEPSRASGGAGRPLEGEPTTSNRRRGGPGGTRRSGWRGAAAGARRACWCAARSATRSRGSSSARSPGRGRHGRGGAGSSTPARGGVPAGRQRAQAAAAAARG
ncbi:unnamed protein product [Pedinophyceae sp. YPF-701]|nr:unnamed protein product [Pedinophyceae sp. YPF-701]